MRQSLPNFLIFLVLAAAAVAGWWYVDKTYFPKPEPKPPEPPRLTTPEYQSAALAGGPGMAVRRAHRLPPREAVLGVTGGAVAQTDPARHWPIGPLPEVAKAPEPPKPAPTPTEAPELIALGDEKTFFKTVLLTTKGGAVQAVTLLAFEDANRLGLEVKQTDGSFQKLRVIPGVYQHRDKVSLTDLRKDPDLGRVPDLSAGKAAPQLPPQYSLSEPSYQLLHYPTNGDPLRSPRDKDKSGEFDEHPSRELADRTWTVAERHHPADGSPHRVVFETTLGAPYHLKLRKTYTLAPKDYHVGLKLDVEALPDRKKEQGKFKYQIAGARNIPVEGEWYVPTYRNVMVGWKTRRGGAKRSIDDARTIHDKHGSDPIDEKFVEDGRYTYAAVATQYFASALAVDDTAPPGPDPWDYVRATREPQPGDVKDQEFLADVTFRAVAKPLDPAPGETVAHHYVIYNGPVKVRLLAQLENGMAVEDGLVNRYLDDLTLKTLTDYHSPNFFGRVANAIWWSDLVIVFTNIMHEGLGAIHFHLGLPWWASIIILTVCVRLILMVPSRKQQASMMRMQEKMAKMKPELDKLQEKYKHDPQLLQQEKARLMFKHGINPLSTMGGCLMLFAQMPIFMGLYFCLQESVFFRLKDFFWVPNLSAPDMTVWWTESVPWISDPSNLGGSIYLGPFLNVLPLLAVGLIFIQQKLTMPPPTDEQQEMQQKMMKIMIIVMAVFFYKVPAGLCLYFICSTSWALLERKLLKKPKAKEDALPEAGGTDLGGAGVKPTGPTKPTEPPENGAATGGFLSRWKSKLEDIKRQADEQSRRQIRNDPPKPGGGGGGGSGGGGGRDKKKKRKK